MVDSTQEADNWESHWASFGGAERENPGVDFRTNAIMSHLGALGPTDQLIDIGCGEGDLLVDLRQHYPSTHLVGVDISKEGLDRAKAKVPDADFLQTDLLAPVPELQRFTGWATHGVCTEVLEHLDDPVLFLRNARSLFIPGAPIVVTVPAGPRSKFDLFIGHRRHFTPKRLRSVFDSAGLEVEFIRRAGFPFFTLYRLTVMIRGDKVVEDAKAKKTQDMAKSVRVVLAVFRVLFKFNLASFPGGWQLIARVRVPVSG